MSRLAKRRIGDVLVALVAAGFAVVLALLAHRVSVQGDQVEALKEGLEVEQQGVEDAGGTPVAPDPEELIEDPDTEISPGAGGSPPGPTDEQVLEAVEDYFLTHPVEDGEDASPAQIAAAVINYLAEHPPAPGEPGPAPTEEQVLNAVAVYLAANPPPAGPPGPPGADGEDADPPSSAEIQAELATYFEAHPIEMCRAGSTAEVLTVLTVGAPTDIVACVVTSE